MSTRRRAIEIGLVIGTMLAAAVVTVFTVTTQEIPPPPGSDPNPWWSCSQAIVDDTPEPAPCLTDGTVVP